MKRIRLFFLINYFIIYIFCLNISASDNKSVIDAKLSQDSDIVGVEVKSALIDKFFPNYRIIANAPDHNRLIAVDKQGEIVSLGNGNWYKLASDQRPYFRNKLSAFIENRGFVISSSQEAIEIAQLIEELAIAPNKIKMLEFNTKNYQLFDDRIYSIILGDKSHWKYKAKKKKNTWVVTVIYVGPPDVSIMVPPIYEISLTKENRFKEILQRDLINYK